MERDFRIVTSGGEIRVSELLRRPEAIFASPLAVGLVVGTFAAVPYIHLHLEARRRFYPHVPLLVHDDASPARQNYGNFAMSTAASLRATTRVGLLASVTFRACSAAYSGASAIASTLS